MAKYLDGEGVKHLWGKISKQDKDTAKGIGLEYDKEEKKLKLTSCNGKELNSEVTLDIKTNYESSISNKELAMPNSVGGINKGTTVKDLEGKTYNKLFDDLLFPTIKPSYGSPYITPVISNSVREIGATAPVLSDFDGTVFNRAEITLNGASYSPKQYRAGAKTGMTVKFGDSTSLPPKMTLGNMSYTVTVSYSAGDTPVDNKGNKTAEPLGAGSITKAINANGTYPVFAYINASESKQKLSLKAWTTGNMLFEFTTLPYTSGTVLFKVPRVLKTLEKFNTNSGKFEVMTTLPNVSGGGPVWENNNWRVEKKNMSINGNNRDYYYYAIKDTQSSNKYKITF